jgi:hypothetical protein
VKKTFQTYILFLTLTAVGGVFANDVIVTVDFDAHEAISDELVGGTMTAEVVNLTGGSIRNVNLRPDGSTGMAISNEVMQFGLLVDGDSRVVRYPFQATQESIDAGNPTNWRLDFDKADGSHEQLIVTVN